MTKETTGANKPDVQDDHAPGAGEHVKRAREEIPAGGPGRLRATRREREIQ